MRAIQLHHLPKAFLALSPGSVPLPLSTYLPKPFFDQPPAQRLVIQFQVFFSELFGCQRRAKIRIPLFIARQHSLPELLLFSSNPHPSSSPLHQPLLATVLESPPHPPGLPVAHPHHSPCLGQAHPFPLDLGQQHHPLPFLATH